MTTRGYFLVLLCSLAISLPNSNASSMPDQSALPEQLQDLKPDQAVYLDIEADDRRPIFSTPGFDEMSCPKAPDCKILTYVNRDVQLTWTGRTKDFELPNAFDGELDEVYFLEVSAHDENSTLNDISGWMRANPLKLQAYDSVFSTQPFILGYVDCKKALKSHKAPTKNCEVHFNQNLVDIAEQIKTKVGRCPVDNPQDLPQDFKSNIVYDEMILPFMKKESLPALKKENGLEMTLDDLIAVDAHARELYSEMARCFDDGLEYPFAVERIILNRANYVKTARETSHSDLAKIFVPSLHAQGLGPLVEVPTQPIQFSNWNLDGHSAKKNLSGIGQSLCPPSNSDKLFWQARELRKPNEIETRIWQTGLKIATEAVLFPEYFRERHTPGLEEYFYTSGVSQPKMKLVRAQALGRPLLKKSCMEIYRDPHLPKISGH